MLFREPALLVVLAGHESDSSVVLRKLNPDSGLCWKNNTDNPDDK